MQGLEVLSPGVHTTIQDSGRVGFQYVGLPRSGPLDAVSFRLANALVGNPAGSPCLEMLLQGPTLKVLAPAIRFGLVGGGAQLEIRAAEGRRHVPAGRSVRVVRGDTVRVGSLGDSVCAYLAIEGGFDVPRVLGSASTYTRAAIGGFQGRRLKAGDVLPRAQGNAEPRRERALAQPLDPRLDQPIRIVLGPQAHYFRDAALETLLAAEYVVSPHADRMGYRLQGAALQHKGSYDIVSDGIVTGAIQVPGSGQPIVLMVDNQTTGGYPKIATVISADVPVVARRKPGRAVRFVEVDVREAERLRREQEAALVNEIARIAEV
jgi:allophanate hydrolase